MLVFAWFPKGKWQLTDEKNGLVPLRIYTNRDVTISNHATNDTIYSVLDALGHKEAVHEEKHFADYLLSYLYASQRMAGLSGQDIQSLR